MRETRRAGVEPVVKSNYDHLVPHANRLLVLTAKGGWRVIKGLVKFAFRLPGMFVRANTKNADAAGGRAKEL